MVSEVLINNSLSNEALFTKELLGNGATLIRHANYARLGAYFQAFSSLSIGFERIGKLCLMLDHFLLSQGTFPTEPELKKSIGHDLIKIYQRSREIVRQRNLKFKFLANLDNNIHQQILHILSNFGQGDRYSNINLLVGSQRQSDPINDWYDFVDLVLYREYISTDKKKAIEHNAKLLSEMMVPSMVFHTSEQGAELNDIEEASIRTGVFKAVAPLRQLLVLQIIRYWVEIIRNLQYKCMEKYPEFIPNFDEIFGGFCNADRYIKTRRRWDTI